jgi:hypothetical protein
VIELAGIKRQSSEVKKEVVFSQTHDTERKTVSTKPKSGNGRLLEYVLLWCYDNMKLSRHVGTKSQQSSILVIEM